jgi:PIN domain nuclease of toxin-antitoxin system
LAVILLDTHVLAWLASRPEKLSRPAASAIRRARTADGIAIADITILEITMMFVRGVLRAQGSIERAVEETVAKTGVQVRSITPGIAALAVQFPHDYSHDPADRLIGATARAEGIALVTRDERIRSSPLLKTIW